MIDAYKKGGRLMKKVLFLILSTVLFSNVVVSAEEDVEITNQVAIGLSNSKEQVQELTTLFGVENNTDTSIYYIDGVILNEYLNDGSDANTGVYSSVIVNAEKSYEGVNVEILTPENITEVSATTYQNAAIMAGATNAEIKIAAVQPVTGEGALAGVYEVFSQAGYALRASDIQAAENLIQIEQILRDETNMSETDISRLITEYNLSIIYALEDKGTLSEQEILSILITILSDYNFQFSENVRNMLVTHGVAFSQSEVSKDPQTKLALEEVMSRYEVLEETYKHGDIEIEIKEIYFTDERNEFESTNFDNVLSVSYLVTNHGDTEASVGNDLTLYVNGNQADFYFLLDDQFGIASPNRSVEVKSSFGFNGSRENMEIELQDLRTWNKPPLVIKLNNDGTPIPGSSEGNANQNDQALNVGSGLTDEVRGEIENKELIELLDAFVEAGLNVMEPRIMKRQDFGIAPLLANEAVQFGAKYAEFVSVDEDGNEDPYNYGRIFLVNDENDLASMKAVYDDLAKESAMFYSHTHSKRNILIQMGGDVSDDDFEKYVAIIEQVIN